VARLAPISIPGLTAIPVIGDLLFHYDIMVYLSWCCTSACCGS